jgi:RNA polymerase sigma factor (sigma-70 family)
MATVARQKTDDAALVEDYRRAAETYGPRSEEASLAFEPIFKKYWPQIHGMAMSRMGVIYAEDLAGETMQTVLERLNGKEVITNLRGLVRHSFEREYATILEKVFQGKKLARAGIIHEDDSQRVKGVVLVSLNAPVAGDENGIELLHTFEDPNANTEDEAARLELVRELHRLIDLMPRQYREPLVYRWLMGRTIRETCRDLNLTMDQVKHNTARGILWLQEELTSEARHWLAA